MSGFIQVFPVLEFFLILIFLTIASFGLQTWIRRKEISYENKKFVKQFVIHAITILLLCQFILLVIYRLLK